MKNYGFIPDTIKPEDYVFGASPVPPTIFQENGQWDEFLPTIERQNINGVETYNCTAFGTLNCIETLIRRVTGHEENFADRAVGITAGTGSGGNSPHVVAEAIRKQPCMIPEFRLPFDASIDSLEGYYSPNPLTADLITIANAWLAQYEFKHEWVFSPSEMVNESVEVKQALLAGALKCSPIGVSVNAWPAIGQDGLYHKEGPDNHWVMLYGYEPGQYWKIFDHYDNEHKKLAWDYDFLFGKRYSIKKKESNPSTKASFLARLVAVLKKIFNL